MLGFLPGELRREIFVFGPSIESDALLRLRVELHDDVALPHHRSPWCEPGHDEYAGAGALQTRHD
jgi:hypothetical protein